MSALPVRAVLLAIRAYKLCISPYFGGSCRFLPSCADYAAEAIEHHGVVRGGWLAVRRLLRCQPLCSAGHDPVPPPVPVAHLAQGRSFAAKSGLKTCATE